MAEIKNCRGCGRMYQSVADVEFCNRCITNDDDFFKVIRGYLYEHPGASIQEVSDETGIDNSKILVFLRQGRIETVGGVTAISCEKCGAGISSGRYCDKCNNDMANNLKSTANELKSAMRKRQTDDRSKGMRSNFKKK